MHAHTRTQARKHTKTHTQQCAPQHMQHILLSCFYYTYFSNLVIHTHRHTQGRKSTREKAPMLYRVMPINSLKSKQSKSKKLKVVKFLNLIKLWNQNGTSEKNSVSENAKCTSGRTTATMKTKCEFAVMVCVRAKLRKLHARSLSLSVCLSIVPLPVGYTLCSLW